MLTYLSRSLLHLNRPVRMSKLKELNESQYLSTDSLVYQQEAEFLKIVEHAKSNVPYYRDTLRDIEVRSLDDITRIPFLTKKIIRNNTDYLKAGCYPPERFIPNTTGGSTGEKLDFFNDANALQASFLMRGNMWTGWRPGEKQIQLWGARQDLLDGRGIYKRFVNTFIHRNKILSSYDMRDQDMFHYQRVINRYKPRLITGYSSALYLFSNFLREHGLEIYSPKGIISSAETLREDQRETIESVFRCKVLNRYGCREVGNISHECSQQKGLHIYTEHIIVEVVDENGQSCGPGKPGEIVLTSLDNYVFPFIRYRVGDIGALSERKCPCGRRLPMLESVEGRVWDIIVGTNGNRLVGTFWLVKGVKGIQQYQVIQEEHGRLVIKLVVDDRFGDKDKQQLIERVKDKCGEDMAVEIKILNNIPMTESGKHRFIISKVSPFIR